MATAFDHVLQTLLEGATTRGDAVETLTQLAGRDPDGFATFIRKTIDQIHGNLDVQQLLDISIAVGSAADAFLPNLGAVVWANAGSALSMRGRHREAIPLLERALASGTDRIKPQDLPAVELELGISFSRTGEAHRGREILLRIERSANSSGLQGLAALARFHISICEMSSGDAASAEASFAKAVEKRRSLSDEAAKERKVGYRSAFHRDFALAARDAGHLDLAIRELDIGYNLAVREDNGQHATAFLKDLAETWMLAGEKRRGEEILRSIGASSAKSSSAFLTSTSRATSDQPDEERPKDPYARLRAASRLLSEEPPRTEKARAMALPAIRDAVALKDLRLSAEGRHLVAISYAREKRPWQAISAAECACQMFDAQGLTLQQMHTRALLGGLYMDTGRGVDAEQILHSAAEMGEAARANCRSGEVRQAISSGLSEVYRQLAYVQATTWRRDAATVQGRRPDKVLLTAQRLLANNLTRWYWLARQVALRHSDELTTLFRAWRESEVRVEVACQTARAGVGNLMQESERIGEGRSRATLGPPPWQGRPPALRSLPAPSWRPV